MVENKNLSSKWKPKDSEYTPGLTKEDWKDLLGDPSVYDEDTQKMLMGIMAIGGIGTLEQVQEKERKSRTIDFDAQVSVFAKNVQQQTSCPNPPEEDGKPSWWAILFYRKALSDGSFAWKVRDELREAFEETGNSRGTTLYEIVIAIESLGGKGKLKDMYDAIEKRGKLPSLSTNGNWRLHINQTIQSFSNCYQESVTAYVNLSHPIFYSVSGLGAGEWGLEIYK